MTEEYYIIANGGDDIIGQSVLIQSHIDRSGDAVKELNKKLGNIVNTNHRLRLEYRKKVANGELHDDTIVERLLSAAKGHEDNEATWAARRCLTKRGIKYDGIRSNQG